VQSKTLCAIRKSLVNALRFGVRRPSTAFPMNHARIRVRATATKSLKN
jgi:hypothetical protein